MTGVQTHEQFLRVKIDFDGKTVTGRTYEVGGLFPNGWIVGPESPETGLVMAIEPVEDVLEGYKTWFNGQEHAEDLEHRQGVTMRQPSVREFSAIGAAFFSATGSNKNARLDPGVKYWTSEASRDQARIITLGDCMHGLAPKKSPQAYTRSICYVSGITLVEP